ncbi:MAG: DNA repair protein RecN [Alphaproteobacteria bacterium]
MLATLFIRNVVLINQLDLEFSPHLNVLTGETGAGKSILLDSLGLALGYRGEIKLIRHRQPQASVVAEFLLDKTHVIHEMLEDQGITPDLSAGSVFLKRVISKDGRSRAFINDQPVHVKFLKEVGEKLIEIHGQFDQYGLLNARTHRSLLDQYSGVLPALAETGKAFEAWRVARDKLQVALNLQDKVQQEEIFLKDAVVELEGAVIQENEEEELSHKRSILMNAKKFEEALVQAQSFVAGEQNGAAEQLVQAYKSLNRLADTDDKKVNALIETLDRLSIEVADFGMELEALGQEMLGEENTLEDVENRLFELRGIARKYQIDPSLLLTYLKELREKLDLIEHGTEALVALRADEDQMQKIYLEKAGVLHEKRVSAGADFDRKVMAELAPLKMENTAFKTQITILENKDDWSEKGIDRVEFMATANPGTPLGPVNKIASGGELSRFTLAMKVVLAQDKFGKSFVFDEVDAGVGGATAEAVGERLKRLAVKQQTLVITHSPQVAAMGEKHFKVSKSEGSGEMVTSVDPLPDSERLEEIARMLSGAEVTDEARKAGARLLETR